MCEQSSKKLSNLGRADFIASGPVEPKFFLRRIFAKSSRFPYVLRAHRLIDPDILHLHALWGGQLVVGPAAADREIDQNVEWLSKFRRGRRRPDFVPIQVIRGFLGFDQNAERIVTR